MRHFLQGDGAAPRERKSAGAAMRPRDRRLYRGCGDVPRATAWEAADYHRHCIVEHADWAAVDNILAMKNITPQTHAPGEFRRIRDHQANGMGGLPLVGDPRHGGARA